MTPEETKNVAIYCKCDRIIFATANLSTPCDDYEDYWNAGYRFGLVNTSDVHKLYGCKCDLPTNAATTPAPLDEASLQKEAEELYANLRQWVNSTEFGHMPSFEIQEGVGIIASFLRRHLSDKKQVAWISVEETPIPEPGNYWYIWSGSHNVSWGYLNGEEVAYQKGRIAYYMPYFTPEPPAAYLNSLNNKTQTK